ncbi:hypothetical protein [Porphyromonas gingivicanis]|uniref:hypothetical protein n=1 Tax=Porphyromonas gingivicanis TaxID=266762 RepID=UPI00046FEAE5|nr:hypothetical protein [Porphyromonas gingivicanis]
MENNAYSRHIFIFPFQWDYIAKKKYPSYNDRTDIKKFDELFSEVSPLKRHYFEIGASEERYNEYTYFHPFARRALFGTEKHTSVYHYELSDTQGTYNISVKADGGSTTYSLQLEKIVVSVFDTGVGTVAYFLRNDKHTAFEDILRINDSGRRIYPQYMVKGNRLKAKDSFLADRIYGSLGVLNFDDDFRQFEGEISHKNTFLPPDHIRQVFGYNKMDRTEDDGYQKFVFHQESERKEIIRISPVMDDRMFFITYYHSPDYAQKLKDKVPFLPREEENIVNKDEDFEDLWFRYLFGDGRGKSVANASVQREDVKRTTYARWSGGGTLFGLTKDSLVGISNEDFIGDHITTMYYQMATLSLVQRSTILRFSNEIATITQQILDKKTKRKTEKQVKELYGNYIRFLNETYFREVTPQIQGIEMYDMLQNNMNIRKDAKALDEEMGELFNYTELEEQGVLNKTANRYLPLTLFVAILSTYALQRGKLFNKIFETQHIAGVCSSNWRLNYGDIITIILLLICLYFPIQNYLKHKTMIWKKKL